MRTALLAIVLIVLALPAHDGARAQSFTTLQFANATDSPVDAWLGLGPESAGRIQDVRLVDIATNQQVPVSGDGLVGRFTLQAHQTVSWNSFNGGVAAGGSVTFRAPPQSCPVPGGPCGVTKGEFTVNNGHESADISSVDGINAIISMDLTDGGANPWPSAPDGSRVAQNSGTLTGDKSLWGVFPYRCTQCAAIGNAPPTDCNPLGPAQQSYCKDGTESNPQPAKCQADRAGAGGGVVKFTYVRAMDPLGESGPAAATAESTGAAPAATTPSPAAITPSALVTPSMPITPSTATTPSMPVTPSAPVTPSMPITPSAAPTPSAVATAHLPPTPPTAAAMPTAQAQPTTAVPVPTARP